MWAKRSILYGAPSRKQNRVPREGEAVKCAAFDWGRDFSVSLLPSFACGKSHLPPRGRNNGSSRTPTPTNGAPSRRPLRSNCIFIFNRNGQDRSLQFFIIHFSLFIHLRGAESSPPTLAFQFARSVTPQKTPILIRCLPSVQTIPAFLQNTGNSPPVILAVNVYMQFIFLHFNYQEYYNIMRYCYAI